MALYFVCSFTDNKRSSIPKVDVFVKMFCFCGTSTEFNPVQQPLLNEKVLRDKRKKLRETFERIVRLYERENPETYKELRKIELDYETKRGQLALYFDSVKVCLCIFVWIPFSSLLQIRICILFCLNMRQA